eukprot:NODE_22_length_42145_cov_1.310612.p11 type:complete len:373 gc:universal NODE_22_length_42145_cov_1.310612:29452-28334(-)
MENLNIFCKLVDSVANVTIEQQFKNNSDKAVEFKYKFPVNDSICVIGFEAKINDDLVIGKLVTKDSAEKVYQDAKNEGNTTAVLHQTAEDMFEMDLGRLGPSSVAIIRIQFVQDLTNDVNANNVRFSYPITMVPRYIAASSTGKSHEENINPEFTSNASYKVHLQMELNMTSKILAIDSSQELKSILSGNTGSVSGSLKTTKDFSVVIECENLDEPVFYLEKYEGFPGLIDDEWVDAGKEFKKSEDVTSKFLKKIDQKNHSNIALTTEKSQCLSMAFVPQFKLKEVPSELIFLLDRSGSMDGNPTELVRSAMLVFLKSIPEDSFFNIVGFGSSFESLFPTSQKYTEQTLKAAEDSIKNLSANLGVYITNTGN